MLMCCSNCPNTDNSEVCVKVVLKNMFQIPTVCLGWQSLNSHHLLSTSLSTRSIHVKFQKTYLGKASVIIQKQMLLLKVYLGMRPAKKKTCNSPDSLYRAAGDFGVRFLAFARESSTLAAFVSSTAQYGLLYSRVSLLLCMLFV